MFASKHYSIMIVSKVWIYSCVGFVFYIGFWYCFVHFYTKYEKCVAKNKQDTFKSFDCQIHI